MRIVVVDAGPVIALSKTGHLGLLPAMFDEVVVPFEVARELTAAKRARPGSEIGEAPWAHVKRVDALERGRLQRRYVLDAGEAAAVLLALASPTDSILLIDELRGLRTARTLGLHTIRTGALLVEAVRDGLLDRGSAEVAVALLGKEAYLGARAAREILALLPKRRR